MTRIRAEYTIGQVAVMMSVHRNTIRRWVEKGILRGIPHGRTSRIPLTALRDVVDRWESLSLKRDLTALTQRGIAAKSA